MMYGGWGPPSQRNPPGFADSDGASASTIERRREADIEFITRVRTCTDRAKLGVMLMSVKGWRVICIERRLKQLDATR